MFVFNLDKALDELNITKNKLSVESRVRSNTVIDLAKGDITRIDLYSLQAILDTLNRLAEERGLKRIYGLSDIIQYTYNGAGKRYDKPDSPLSEQRRAEIIVEQLAKVLNRNNDSVGK